MQGHHPVLVKHDLSRSAEGREDRRRADEEKRTTALGGLQAGEWPIAGLPGAELDTLELWVPRA